jgi:hypothetical protein
MSPMQFKLDTKILHYATIMKQTAMTTFQMRSALFKGYYKVYGGTSLPTFQGNQRGQ